jgi:hypothetical protein
MPSTVVGRSIKVTVPLDPDSVLAVSCPDGAPSRTVLTVRVGSQTLNAEVASKAIRRVQATIRQGHAFCMRRERWRATVSPSAASWPR